MSGLENVGKNKLEFQVIVRILEARNLVGLDIDPFIEVSIRDQKRRTKTKISTNSAVFDEDFTFTFSLPPVLFHQQIITIEAISDSRLSSLRSALSIGSFKIDVATVKSQPERCFVHKWALLLDSADPLSGPKGYVKCDIIICTPGIVPKMPIDTNKGDEDIEGNLLIPEDFSKNIERQPARYFVTIFEAKDLPPKTTGVIASMKKALVGDAPKELLDPFVQVSFAGKTGKTKVKKNCVNPKWNEEIVFYEMFPSLVKIMKIRVKDENLSIIATTFLDFALIADNSMNGFLPTFGPAWLNLYGNHRDSSDESLLNCGVGEGLAYRGSLKISLSVQLMDAFPQKGMHLVENRNVQHNQTNIDMISMERFLLFCTIFETDMIDKRYSGRQAHFEISFGKAGSEDNTEIKGKENSFEKDESQPNKGLARTPSAVIVSKNKLLACIPNCAKKPCMHLFMDIEDFRIRLFMINRMKNLSSDLQKLMKQVRVYFMNNFDESFIRNFLMNELKRFLDDCKFVIHLLDSEYVPIDFATNLDLERQKQRKSELGGILKSLTDLKKQSDEFSVDYLITSIEKCIARLNTLANEPQDSLPDVYLWLVCDNRKIAYKRIKPEDLLYSTDENERGNLCSKVQQFFLKTPIVTDKEEDDALCFNVKAYFWLGTMTEKVYCITDLPPIFSFDLDEEYLMPLAITYTEVNEFELRCHMFQGRSLLGSDDSGLSDPFVRVSFSGQCQQSQIIEQNLCPIWDECLVFPKIVLYGCSSYISNNPPLVTVQVYDFDKVGENEFLGQCNMQCVIKLAMDHYSKPKFPPSLECYTLVKNKLEVGEILAVCELIQLGDDVKPFPELDYPEKTKTGFVQRIPKYIKPILSDYKLYVLFWGLRDLKASSMLPIEQPKVQIDWGNGILESETIISNKKNPNFKTLVKTAQIKLPDDFNYQPPITIRCVDSRAFGRNVLIGTCTVNSIRNYIAPFAEESDKSVKDQNVAISMPDLSYKCKSEEQLFRKDIPKSLSIEKQMSGMTFASTSHDPAIATEIAVILKEPDNRLLDWWSKYYTSIEEFEKSKDTKNQTKPENPKKLNHSNLSLYEKAKSVSSRKIKNLGKQLSKTDIFKSAEYIKSEDDKSKLEAKKQIVATFEIYETELEDVPEFNGFKDCFEVFNLYRGKKLSEELDDSSRIAGKFKGLLRFQKITNDTESPMIARYLNNEPVKVMVRIYVVKALNLRPCDVSGKADPYLNVILGKTKISDKANKIISELNPIFGKMFEIEANFPEESELTIQIFDWDRLTKDDLMGETKIDLEQRYYSKHRASCGLQSKYESTGYNAWRDSLKPTQLLSKMCKLYGLSGPTYTAFSVTVDDKVFTVPKQIMVPIVDKENLALSCLHQLKDLPKVGFAFVPEHIETRTLYLPGKPEMEQGKLEMWIDMFPIVGHTLPLPVNITPRKANSYELRVIIWDTQEVILDDYNALTDTASVDQYIKCSLISPDVDGQHTDVHYRSLNGDGNFNWRFIFKFDYMDAEDKIVHRVKQSAFSLVEKEEKLPAKLNLQVWDADVISADDFLGNLSLNLSKLPRGAKSAKTCRLETMMKPNINRNGKSFLNLFEVKRARGWYPFVRQEKKGAAQLAGKVDIELQLMSADEAEKKPAGRGRDGPDALPPPHRPETSVAWFSSPFKMLQHDLWMSLRWKLLQLSIVLVFVLFICIFIYTLPEALAQKFVQTYV